MSAAPPEAATDLDPRLSYLLCPRPQSVTRLLNLSLTEIIPPASPNLPNTLSAGSATNLSGDTMVVKECQDYVVKEHLIARPSRCLLTNTSCSCLPAQHFKATNQPISGWETKELVVSLSHFIASAGSPPPNLGKGGNSVSKSLSTGKIEASRVFKGYPYEKTDIPFHFQHFEEEDTALDRASSYAKMYRRAFTYPNMEDKLKSTSVSDYTSFSAPSVIEPKILTFVVSKPGVADSQKPFHNKQSHQFYSSLEAGRKGQNTHIAKLHQAFNSLVTRSTPILEVYHGQASEGNYTELPHPTTPDSPPFHNQTSHHIHTGTRSQTTPHFKDIINIDDTHYIKNRKKPSVRWASHTFPLNFVPSQSSDVAKQTVSSPKPKRQQAGNTQARKTKPVSLTRDKDVQAPIGIDVPSPRNMSDHLASSFTPKFKAIPARTSQNEDKGLKGTAHRQSHDHNYPRIGKTRPKKQPSLQLMPTSKPLMPSALGIYSRTALTQRTMDYM